MTIKTNWIHAVHTIKKNGQSISFLISNIIVAFLGFFRSGIFMEYLDFKALGVITLIQTSAMAIGFLQLGLINGGYRIIAVNTDLCSIKRTTNTIFSYLLVMTLVIIAASFLMLQQNIFADSTYVILVISLAVFLLINNWLSNFLIAKKDYTSLNKINLLSAFGGLACLPLAYSYGVVGAVLSLVLQPLTFVILVLYKNRETRPIRFDLRISSLRYILRFGFVPFLSGMFFLLYVQIERWSIGGFIGSEALGHAYLFFMIVALWGLIPTSVMNLFFPRSAKYFHNKQYESMNRIIKYHTYVVFLYCTFASLMIVFLLPLLVEFIFPNHLPYTGLVIIALPGLICRSIIDPLSVFFNSVVKLKPIFWSDLFSLLIYIVFITLVVFNEKFSLQMAVYSFVLYFFSKLLFMLVCYYSVQKSIKQVAAIS